jgi:hypothetical protein
MSNRNRVRVRIGRDARVGRNNCRAHESHENHFSVLSKGTPRQTPYHEDPQITGIYHEPHLNGHLVLHVATNSDDAKDGKKGVRICKK